MGWVFVLIMRGLLYGIAGYNEGLDSCLEKWDVVFKSWAMWRWCWWDVEILRGIV